ncbi:MAG: hypothetical protein H6966_00665 [Chromatiaceae bacterium]|nr:hypothetical protein [Chromatiaceae bacterium]
MADDDRTIRTNESLEDYSNRLAKNGGSHLKSTVNLRIIRSKGFEYRRQQWLKNRPQPAGGNICSFLIDIEKFGNQLIAECTNQKFEDGKEPFEVYAGHALRRHARNAFEIMQTSKDVFDVAHHIQSIYELLLEPTEKQRSVHRKNRMPGIDNSSEIRRKETEDKIQDILSTRDDLLKEHKSPSAITGILANRKNLSRRRINELINAGVQRVILGVRDDLLKEYENPSEIRNILAKKYVLTPRRIDRLIQSAEANHKKSDRD